MCRLHMAMCETVRIKTGCHLHSSVASQDPQLLKTEGVACEPMVGLRS